MLFGSGLKGLPYGSPNPETAAESESRCTLLKCLFWFHVYVHIYILGCEIHLILWVVVKNKNTSLPTTRTGWPNMTERHTRGRPVILKCQSVQPMCGAPVRPYPGLSPPTTPTAAHASRDVLWSLISSLRCLSIFPKDYNSQDIFPS